MSNSTTANDNQNQTRWSPKDLKLVIHQGVLCDDVLRMREKIYRDETRFLSDENLTSKDDEVGTHFCLYYNGTLIAATLGVKAEESSFSKWSGIAPKHLTGAYYGTRSMVAPEYRNRGLLILLLYILLREGRILGRKKGISYLNDGNPLVARITTGALLKNARPLQYTGHQGYTYSLVPMYVDINYGMYRCWKYLSRGLRDFVAANLLTDEVIRTVVEQTAVFYKNAWLQQVTDGTLTREQYIEFLANNYQFVRWTTRLLARIAGVTDNQELRNHYLNHLSGEIDHEKIVESDLSYLEADVDYIQHYMAPCIDIGHFMGVQESLVGFRADPYTFLAVPIAIESLSAHLNSQFLKDLEACVRSWGYAEPAKATAYLRSHISFDGAEDGHWVNTGRAITKFLKTEPDTQRFLGVTRMVITAINRALESYVEHPDLM